LSISLIPLEAVFLNDFQTVLKIRVQPFQTRFHSLATGSNNLPSHFEKLCHCFCTVLIKDFVLFCNGFINGFIRVIPIPTGNAKPITIAFTIALPTPLKNCGIFLANFWKLLPRLANPLPKDCSQSYLPVKSFLIASPVLFTMSLNGFIFL